LCGSLDELGQHWRDDAGGLTPPHLVNNRLAPARLFSRFQRAATPKPQVSGIDPVSDHTAGARRFAIGSLANGYTL
jgi:hypothetical protein